MKKFSIFIMLLVFSTSMTNKTHANNDPFISPFSDVSSDHWAYDAIIHGFVQGIFNGYPDNTYKINNAITREEFAAIVERTDKLFNHHLGINELDEWQGPSPFVDVSSGEWFSQAINNGYKKGLWKGYENIFGKLTFGVGLKTTRGQAALVYYRDIIRISKLIEQIYNESIELEQPTSSFISFSDIPKWHSAEEAIKFLKFHEIISGFQDGTFLPDAPITRAELSVMNRNFFEFINKEINRLISNKGDVAFVTSISLSGNINSLKTADNFCGTIAEQSGLGSNYKAWLSSDSESPSTRFSKGSAPYITTRLTTIAKDWNDLIDGTLQNPIQYDENGLDVSQNTFSDEKTKTILKLVIASHNITSENKISDKLLLGLGKIAEFEENFVWTGSNFNGEATNDPNKNCNNWNTESSDYVGQVGDLRGTNSMWSKFGYYITPTSCNQKHRLYCFEQSEEKDDPKISEQVKGLKKTAFITSEGYQGNLQGVLGADKICQEHAKNAGLLGEYISTLLPNISDEISNPAINERLAEHKVGPDYNPDIVYVNTQGKLIADGDYYDLISYQHATTEKVMNEKYDYYDEYGIPIPTEKKLVWGGIGSRTPLGNNCNNWTSSNGDHSGAVNELNFYSCSSEIRLSCVEK